MSQANVKEVDWEFPDKLGFLFDHYRYKIAHGGRNGAKSWGFSRSLLIQGSVKPLRILCAREIQKSIKDSVHQLLCDQIEELGLGSFYTILANEIKGQNGTSFGFTGLSDQTINSLKSYEGADICWVEEAQTVRRRSFDILLPTIRKSGSEVWLSLNPELDSDEAFARFIIDPPKDAYVQEINYNDNPWASEESENERKELLRLVDIGIREQDDYDNIWLGKCRAAVAGAIYYKEVTEAKLKGRLRDVPYDPMLKVHTIWDLGRSDYMAIIMVQKVASEIRVIDYIEDSHRTLADYVLTQEPGREDLSKRKYNWGTDYLPHDGTHKTIHHELSAIQQLKSLGRDVYEPGVPDIGVESGIRSARLMFPRVYFDKDKAATLFNRLGRYKRRINQSTLMAETPLHDENSHGADGFRYLSVIENELTNEMVEIKDPYAGFRRQA